MFGKKLWKVLGGVLLLALVGAQFVPVERTNPPVELAEQIAAPTEVLALLKRACFDCHSNETRWPWYAHVAPMSWLVAEDVEDARKEMNFSTWQRMSAKRQAKLIHEIVEEVEDDEMPPWFYTPLHAEAEVTKDDLATLERWAKAR